MVEKFITFDRTVTISLCFTVMFESAGALLWAGSAEARIAMLESQIRKSYPIAERLARLEEKMDMTRLAIDRVEQSLDNKSPR